MAQRKSPPTGKSSSRPGGKPGAKSAAAKSGAANSAGKGPAGRTPPRKKPKSIVNQKQTPWGLIATTVAIVIFAAAIVVVVIATRKSDDSTDTADSSTTGGQTVKSSDPYRQPEAAAAAAIKGVVYRVQAQHDHKPGTIKYDTTPPTGGNHNAFWADCTGTVYDQPIANENAVHMLEHGAVWITYNADDIKGAQLTKLKTYVSGVDRMAMSPYPGLSSPISLQAWGYQLKLDSPGDPRIAQFIKAVKYNKQVTPEFNATCSQPDFKENPSSFGKPSDGY